MMILQPRFNQQLKSLKKTIVGKNDKSNATNHESSIIWQ
jgi:hypothetical protein